VARLLYYALILVAALVEETIFCMHGGLSPSMHSFDQVPVLIFYARELA